MILFPVWFFWTWTLDWFFLDIKSGLSGTLDRWKPYHLINIIKVLLLLFKDKSETALLFFFGIYSTYRRSTKLAYARPGCYNRIIWCSAEKSAPVLLFNLQLIMYHAKCCMSIIFNVLTP
jgi:hypothetical protein